MDNGVIAEIKSKIDLVEFVGQYVTLKKAGKHYAACCPFHQEKSPSFVVSPEREMWYCFGACHEGGDVISFLMKWENISFYEALKELSYRTGVQLKDARFDDREFEKKDLLYKINHLASEYFQHILHNTKFGTKAKEYLLGRTLNEKIIRTFQIGYAPESWESLLKFLKAKGYAEADIARTGLVVRSDRGTYYDRFRGRIVFPLKDARDNIVGFSGRLMADRPGDPKYINISETEIYRKRESLYGIHIVKDGIRKSDTVIVVEGEFDVIVPYQHGVENIVAIKGSSVTRDHLKILKRYAKKIVFCLDADAAGADAVMRAIREADEMDVELRVMVLTAGKDPDEAVRTDIGAFKDALKHAEPAYDYVIDAISKKYPEDSPFEKKKAGDELVPFLAMIKNPIVLDHYVKNVAMRIDTSEESVRELLASYQRRQAMSQAFRPKEAGKAEVREEDTGKEYQQKYLLSYLLQEEEPAHDLATVLNILEPRDFATPALQKLAQVFVDYLKLGAGFCVKEFLPSIPAELLPTFDSIYHDPKLYDKISLAKNEDVERRAIEIKIDALKRRKDDLIQRDDDEADAELQDTMVQLRTYEQRYNLKTGKISPDAKKKKRKIEGI
jgi:DNA primase